MLHQHFTLSFPFNLTFSSSATSTLTFSHPSSSKVKVEMECVEAKAMKTSFWPELNVKLCQQQQQEEGFVITEELLGGNGTNCGLGEDNSFVDEFLDFSKEDVEKEEEQEEEEDGFVAEEEEEERDCSSVSSQEQNSSRVSVKDAFGSPPTSELCVPVDDLADLEWVSHFVDDSFSEFSFPCPAGNPPPKTQTPKQNRSYSGPVSGISSMKSSNFPPQITTKRSRTKRKRTNGRIWSLGSPFSESTSSSSSSSSSQTSCLIFPNITQNPEFLYFVGNPPEKKQKRKPVSETQRRCSHCGVQKTPQWRAGPLGSKTLCNACGVRYKSGRLLPEYRPACSPTFSSDVHSNNHRKVLEMRRKKEISPSESELVPSVHSF